MDLKYLSLQDYANLPEDPQQYLIDRFLPCPGRVLLVGPPKAGKSYLALQIGLAVANGQPFLGRPAIPGGRRVLYLQFDTPHKLWRERMIRLQEEGIPMPPYRQNREQGDFIVLDPTSLRKALDIANNPDDVAYLIQIMNDLKPSLVIVDTLSKLHTGEENDAGAMKKVFYILNSIFAEACIIYVHHTKKLSPQPGQKILHRPSPSDAARGSSFLAGEVDAIHFLWGEIMTTEVRFDENGSYHCKQNPHTHMWDFDEVHRIERLEVQLRNKWNDQAWPSWIAFRHYVIEHFPKVPDHLLLRLRTELEPTLSAAPTPAPDAISPRLDSPPSDGQSHTGIIPGVITTLHLGRSV